MYHKNVLGQENNNEIIWNKSRKLTWEDYKGKPVIEYAAISSCGIHYKILFNHDTLIITITAVLNKEESAVQKEYRNHNHLLMHEQGHFDLTELYARESRKQLLGHVYANNKTKAMDEAEKQLKEVREKLNVTDIQYDEETDFSRSLWRQEYWTEKIDKELLKLDAYSNTVIKIALK